MPAPRLPARAVRGSGGPRARPSRQPLPAHQPTQAPPGAVRARPAPRAALGASLGMRGEGGGGPHPCGVCRSFPGGPGTPGPTGRCPAASRRPPAAAAARPGRVPPQPPPPHRSSAVRSCGGWGESVDPVTGVGARGPRAAVAGTGVGGGGGGWRWPAVWWWRVGAAVFPPPSAPPVQVPSAFRRGGLKTPGGRPSAPWVGGGGPGAVLGGGGGGGTGGSWPCPGESPGPSLLLLSSSPATSPGLRPWAGGPRARARVPRVDGGRRGKKGA